VFLRFAYAKSSFAPSKLQICDLIFSPPCVLRNPGAKFNLGIVKNTLNKLSEDYFLFNFLTPGLRSAQGREFLAEKCDGA